ncbi:MAG: quinolinate synthase NadA, partial [Gemmatimonadales bacterium]
KEAPQGRFYAASERAICRYMKKITLDKLLTSLRDDVFEVTVAQEVADKARLAIQRMVEI